VNPDTRAGSSWDEFRGLSRLVANVVGSSLGQFSTAIVGLVLTPLLIRQLGNEAFGLWVLAGSLLGFVGLLDLGVASAVVKYVAEFEARDDHQAAREAVSTAFAIHLLLGLVAGCLVLLGGNIGLGHLGIDDALMPPARTTLAIVALTLGVSLPLDLLGALLLGYQRYDLANGVNVAATVGSAAASAAVVLSGGGLVELALVSLCTSVTSDLLKFALARSVSPHLRLSPRFIRRGRMREILRLSFWLSFFKLALRFFDHADAVLIGFFLSAAAITPYTIGMKLASGVSYISGPMVNVFFPLSSSLQARYDRRGLHRLLIEGTRLALALTLPAVLFLLVFGHAVVERWVGPGHEASEPILAAFLAIYLLGTVQQTAATILRGIGRPEALTLVVVAEGASNLALSIVLIPRLGILGAALGTLLPSVVSCIAVIPWLACRSVRLSPWQFFRQSVVPPCIPVPPLLAALWLAAGLLSAPSVPTLLATAALSALLYAALYLGLGVGAADRLEYRRQLVGLLRHWGVSRRPSLP
jgi:O-antigen/teichoic acid export membrane protein